MGFPAETIPRLLTALLGLLLVVLVAFVLSVRFGESRLLKLIARIRYPTVVAFFVVFLVPLGFALAPTMVYSVFVLEGPVQFASVTCASLLLAMLAYATTRLAIEHGDERFGPIGYKNLRPKTWQLLRRLTIFPVGSVVPAAAAIATYQDEAVPNIGTVLWIAGGVAAGYFCALTVWYIFAFLERILVPPALVLPGFFPVSGWKGLDAEPRLITDRFWNLVAQGFGPAGNGYTHEINGRLMLKPGHAQLMVFWLALLFLYFSRYVSVGVLGFSNSEATAFPVLFHVLTILLLLGSTLTGAAFLLDYYRLPVIAVLIVLTLGANVVFDNDHYYELRESQSDAQAPLEIKDLYANWNFPRCLDDKRTLLLVTASGGGIQASAWTAKVLTELSMRYQGFHDSIGAISGVSGGSVATMYYTLYCPQRDNTGGPARRTVPPDRAQAIFRDASRSNLEAAAWGFAYPDLMRLAFPPLVPDQVDRGWAMEQIWNARLQQRGFKIDGGEAPTLRTLAQEVAAGRTPAPIFNATIVETGQRVMMSPISGLGVKADRSEEAWGFFDLYPDADLRVTTAVRLSATFSYVSPICRPGVANEDARRFHIADGGYADNEGLVAALQTAFNAAEYQTKGNKKFDRILLIRIVPFPATKLQASSSRMGWLFSTFGPLLTLNSVRVGSQAERGHIEVEAVYAKNVMQSIAPGIEFHAIQFKFEPTDENYTPPLSWKLTKADFRAIDDAWKNLEWNLMGPGGNKPPSYLDEIFPRGKAADAPVSPGTEATTVPRLATRPKD